MLRPIADRTKRYCSIYETLVPLGICRKELLPVVLSFTGHHNSFFPRNVETLPTYSRNLLHSVASVGCIHET